MKKKKVLKCPKKEFKRKPSRNPLFMNLFKRNKSIIIDTEGTKKKLTKINLI